MKSRKRKTRSRRKGGKHLSGPKTQNPELSRQTRKVLRTHYAAKYRVR